EFGRLVPNAPSLDRVLLEADRPKRGRVHPGDHVFAHEKEFREEVVGQRGELELVDGLTAELRVLGRERELAAGDPENRHPEDELFSEENGSFRRGSGGDADERRQKKGQDQQETAKAPQCPTLTSRRFISFPSDRRPDPPAVRPGSSS